MMIQSAVFKEEFDKLYSNIEKYYNLAIQGFDTEDIHNLRVTIKRLRAFYYLINAINPDFNIQKNYKSARKLFKKAGRIRDIQIQICLASTWQAEIAAGIDPYLEVLRKKESHRKNEFQDFAKQFNLKKIFRRQAKVARTLEKVSLSKAEKRSYQYFTSRFKKILKLGNVTRMKPKELHRLRILTKEFRYNLEFIIVCVPQLTFPAALIIELQKVHHILGLINDLNVARRFFSNLPIDLFAGQKFEQVNQKIEMEISTLYDDFKKQWMEFTHLFPDRSIFILRSD